MVLAFCLFLVSHSPSVAQGQRWAYPPHNINMNGSTPVITNIPGANALGNNISNGAYDASGNLLFYVKDLKVYTATSQLKGKLPMPNSGGAGYTWTELGSEVEIVPVPGSGLCNKFYVIYTVRDLTHNVFCLCYVVINMTPAGPVIIGPAYNSTLSASYYWQNVLEWIYFDAQGLAVSKLTSNNTRYLFTLGFAGSPSLPFRNQTNNGGLLRWTIDASGIHSQTVIAGDNTALVNNLGSYYETDAYLTVTQLSLSDDQTRLAWGGGTKNSGLRQWVFEVKLSPNFTYVPGSYRQYSLPYPGGNSQAAFVSGVEYVAGTNKLYVSSREGLYYIPSHGASPIYIAGSASLTRQPNSSVSGSQLQYVKSTGKIVGVKPNNTAANTGTLFSIDPNTNTTATISTTPLMSKTRSFSYTGGGFILPEQVPDVAPPNCASLLAADFTFQTNYNSPNNFFTVTATPLNPPVCSSVVGDLWIIEQLDTSGNVIAGTNTITGVPANPNCWWIYPAPNTFPGFDGTKNSGINNVTCPTPSPGKFLNSAIYRITHGVWTSTCPWSQTSHTVSVSGQRRPDFDRNAPDYSHLRPRGVRPH